MNNLVWKMHKCSSWLCLSDDTVKHYRWINTSYENMFCGSQTENAVRDVFGFERGKKNKCMITTFADANK